MTKVCKECGKTFKRISWPHLWHKHHMTTDEYYNKYNIIPNKEQLIELYIMDKLSLEEIANVYGSNDNKILNLMKEFDIPRRNLSVAWDKSKHDIKYGNDSLFHRPEIIEKNRERMLTNNPMKNPIVVEKNKATRNTLEYKELHSGINHHNYGQPPSIRSGRGHGSYFINPLNNKRVWMYSTYETRFAKCLVRMNISWYYAPKSFELGEIGSYRPDFYLPKYDIWFEVKGLWWPVSIDKMKAFNIHYPDKHLRIVYEKEIILLEKYNEIDISRLGTSLNDHCKLW